MAEGDMKDAVQEDFVPAGPEHEETVVPVDVDHEHSLKVSAMMEEGFYDKLAAGADFRTRQDGGVKGERLPSHREGEVWESMAPEDDEAGGGRRRVRVEVVAGGEVQARNVVTGVVSHFKASNLVAPRWRRAHS